METYSRVTRFIFICNYVSRIIEPLASRCAKFRFKPLQGEVIYGRIEYICNEEGVELGAGSLEALGAVCGGDMRKAITTLQSAYRLKGSQGEPFQKVQQAVEDVIADGYPAQEILKKIQNLVLDDGSMPESTRGQILVKLAEADKDLVDGSDEHLQLLAVAAHIQQVLMT
eukprot:jgi/Picre1/35714/NNA_003174.t1